MTDDIVNTYTKENPEIVTQYLRNERAMKTQRKQINAKSLLQMHFKIIMFCFLSLYIYIYLSKWRIRRNYN